VELWAPNVVGSSAGCRRQGHWGLGRRVLIWNVHSSRAAKAAPVRNKWAGFVAYIELRPFGLKPALNRGRRIAGTNR